MRFILVDRILELVPGQRIKATKIVSPDEDFLKDHFPGFPVIPGVLLTEMMGQAASKCLESEHPGRGKPMLARITDASFREWVRPGQLIILSAEVRSSRAQFAIADCQAEVDGRKVCSAELMFTFASHAQFAPGYRDHVLEEFLAGANSRSASDQKT